MATQNPIEMEGTYPLPEAQLDRFLMKILVEYPSREDLNRIVDVTTKNDEVSLQTVMGRDQIAEMKAICRQVVVAPHVQDYAISVIMATQPGVKGAARDHQSLYTLRQFAAWRAGSNRMRASAGSHARPHAFEH